MQDGIIKGTGNSWNLKSVPNFLTLYPTYEAFVQALIDGTLPVDLNGMNPNGWQQMGTILSKANLLKDSTAALYGKTGAAVPDELFAYIQPILAAAKENSDLSGKIYYSETTVGADFGSVITVPRKPVFAVTISSGTNSSGLAEYGMSVSMRPDMMLSVNLYHIGSVDKFGVMLGTAKFTDTSVSTQTFGINDKKVSWFVICE